ncbi:MAG: hypothetical protein H6Q72_2699 [Firmicutes bacterium]|nr:hypothetical protein [Bacillota bacterium]
MSNQVVLWSMIIVPWLTLFFMKKEEIKRFMPVALFSVITSIVIVEVGQTLGWWIVRETAYPLKTVSYLFGLNPVMTIWLFHFLYGRFWRYVAIDLILNFGFVFLFLVHFIASRGITQRLDITPLQNVLLSTLHGVLLYGYQMWQEGVLVRSKRTNVSAIMQPVLAKPIPQNEEDEGL